MTNKEKWKKSKKTRREIMWKIINWSNGTIVERNVTK